MMFHWTEYHPKYSNGSALIYSERVLGAAKPRPNAMKETVEASQNQTMHILI